MANVPITPTNADCHRVATDIQNLLKQLIAFETQATSVLNEWDRSGVKFDGSLLVTANCPQIDDMVGTRTALNSIISTIQTYGYVFERVIKPGGDPLF